MADDGPLQMLLSGQQSLAEITSPDYPRQRLVACRNPVLAADRARTRGELLAATEKLVAPVIARVAAGRLTGAAAIGVEVGKVISKYKTAKHFTITITGTTLAVTRNQAQIDAEAVTAYKTSSTQDFRHIKADDLDLRPIWHWLEDRVKAHVLICMLGCYLAWHLRRAWAPLTFIDENPPVPADPVLPASRSARPAAKASRQHDETGRPQPQLPRPASSPWHPHPQPGPLRRHPHHRPDAGRADQHPAPGIRPHRRPYSPHPEVARTPSPPTAANRRSGLQTPTQPGATSD